ncbi:MAG: hypothetical protein ACXWWR_04645, partial [Candidatus Limnocylindrales bacterium]
LARIGTALLVAEHKTDLLDQLCGRVAVVVDGMIASEGTANDVFEDPRLGGWGVEPPARVRLGHSLAASGLDPAMILT